MITRIQNMLLKHNKWLFSALLVVIIVTFVLTIGNQNFGGHRTFESQSVDYYGYDLTDGATVRLLQQYAEVSMGMDPEMSYSMAFRRSVGSAEDYALLRVAALGLANQVGIPEPTDDELKAFLRSRSAFVNPTTGDFDATRYKQFTDFLVSNPLYTESMVVKVLKEDYRIARLRDTLSGPGYILPIEGQKSYLEQETEWTVELATIDYADFDPEITLEEADIVAYYEQNPLRYTLPERIQASVIRFNSENFRDLVPAPAEAALAAYFAGNRFRYQPAPAPDATEPAAEVTLEEVRDTVLADYIHEQAIQIARAKSENFSVYLYESGIARNSAEFQAALTENGGVVEPIAPYARNVEQGRAGLPADLLNSAWILATSDRYFSDLAETPQGAALLIYETTIPEELQSLAAVRPAVEAAWTNEEKRRLFSEQAAAWDASLRASTTDAESFKRSAEALGFSVEAPETFKASNRPDALNGRSWEAVRQLSAGELSEVVVTESAVFVAYVGGKNSPPDMASAAQMLYQNQLKDEREEFGGWFVLREWTSKTLAQLEPEEQAL